MEQYIVIIFCVIVFVVIIVLFIIQLIGKRNKIKMERKINLEKYQKIIADQEMALKKKVERARIYAEIMKLSKNKSQESAIEYVLACFEEEDCLKIIDVEPLLGFLERYEVKGPDFHYLFMFLHKTLIEKGCYGEAKYLCIKMGLHSLLHH